MPAQAQTTLAQQSALASSLFAQEVTALCRAGLNADGTPDVTLPAELLAAYALLRVSGQSVWHLYDDKGRLSPRLQYLYALRHALDVLLRCVSLDVTSGEAGVTESVSDEFAHFLSARKELTSDIALLESRLSAGFGFAIGQMATVQPLTPPSPNGPDANDARYRGGPYPSLRYYP